SSPTSSPPRRPPSWAWSTACYRRASYAFVADWADRLAAGPPLALSMTKRLLTNSFTTTMDEALEAEGLAQSVNTATEDTAEAIRAFLEKREPRFKGR